jgi:hypothetical protein
MNLEDRSIGISPTLGKNTECEVVVTTGAKDRAGNRLDQSRKKPNNQQKEWTFTTGTI